MIKAAVRLASSSLVVWLQVDSKPGHCSVAVHLVFGTRGTGGPEVPP